MVHSAQPIGMPRKSRAQRYGIMKAPPPLAAACPGKRRKLPSPTAEPATARMTPSRVPHSSVCPGLVNQASSRKSVAVRSAVNRISWKLAELPGGSLLGQDAVMSAVEEVDHQPDPQPRRQAPPVVRGQREHEQRAGQNAGDGHEG